MPRWNNKNCGFQKGRIVSEETRNKIKSSKKMRKETLGYTNSPETRLKMSLSRKGKKSSMGMLGKHLSEETKDKIRKNSPKYWLGKSLSLETKKKLSEAHRGEKSRFWKGGIWNDPYPVDWTNSLKISIRERDRYTCKVCGEKQGDRAHSVHHIDYNKENCNPNNLITLCNKCHSKTGINREYWINYFNNILKDL